MLRSLLPGIEQRRLPVADAVARLRDPRFVPVAIDPTQPVPLVYVADLGTHECSEWQHIIAVQALARRGLITDYFSASAELLDKPNLVPQARSPRGFILHTSRCGSTLLCKALGRVDGIGALSQPSALQQGFWAWISDGWRSPRTARIASNPLLLARFRNLMNLLCRPRLDAESKLFIKFISWNSLYVDFLQAAFPQVPMLFMYRDPVDVVASIMHTGSAALLAKGTPLSEFLTGRPASELRAMDSVDYLSMCYLHAGEAILRARSRPMMLAFSALAPNALEQIFAAAFGLYPDRRQLDLMQEPFALYSKDDRNLTQYRDNSLYKRKALGVEEIRRVELACNSCYAMLRESASNVL